MGTGPQTPLCWDLILPTPTPEVSGRDPSKVSGGIGDAQCKCPYRPDPCGPTRVQSPVSDSGESSVDETHSEVGVL